MNMGVAFGFVLQKGGKIVKKLLIVLLAALVLFVFYSISLTQVSPGTTLELFQAQTKVFLNEIELNPSGEDAGFQWIELFNGKDEAVDLSGWIIMVDVGQVGPLTLQLPQGTVLQAGQFFVQTFPAREPLLVENTSIELCDGQERVMDQTPALSDDQDDARCWARVADGAEEWQFKTCSQGTSNAGEM